MADLDPALQTSISELQTRHTALVDAVRNYSGGSVSQATNDLIAAKDDVLTTVDKRESALLGLIQRNTTKPVPSLLSDFSAGTYMLGTRRLEHGVADSDMWTCERSTPKWVVGINGKLEEVPPNTPAYEYDHVTGERYLLVEEGGENLIYPSQNFNSWGGLAAVEATSEPSVINGDFWQKLIVSDSPNDAAGARFKIFNYTAGKLYTLSVFVKPGALGEASLRLPSSPFGGFQGVTVDIATGAIVETSGSVTSDDVTWIPFLDGSARIALTKECVATESGQTRVYAGDLSQSVLDGVSGIYTSGAQLEEGKLSSYIPTHDAPATRAKDSVYREMGAEFNSTAFTVVLRTSVQLRKNMPTYNVFEIGELYARYGLGTNGNQYDINAGTNHRSSWSTQDPATDRVFAFVFDSGTMRVFDNYEYTVSLDQVGFSPGVLLRLPRTGKVSIASIYPYAMSEAQLQELTSS